MLGKSTRETGLMARDGQTKTMVHLIRMLLKLSKLREEMPKLLEADQEPVLSKLILDLKLEADQDPLILAITLEITFLAQDQSHNSSNNNNSSKAALLL